MNDSLIPPRVAANDASPADTADLPIDDEIAALLEFEPVPRKVKLEGGWAPEKQRQFLIRLAEHGSPRKAAMEVGMEVSGARKLYYSPFGASFRAAWDGMVELAKRRRAELQPAQLADPGIAPPSIDHRRRAPSPQPLSRFGGEGQVLNEYGEWEDEESFARRADDARDSISNKLRRARRLFLHEISDDPAKRAAFEILTSLPIDWDKAAQCLPQADEPWRQPRAREADMLLTAEAGWLGEFVHGPDKKAELLKEINEWRAERGLEPVGWKGEGGTVEE
jgi:hypothetical protein